MTNAKRPLIGAPHRPGAGGPLPLGVAETKTSSNAKMRSTSTNPLIVLRTAIGGTVLLVIKGRRMHKGEEASW